MNGLIVCNTIFAHNDIYKYTRVSLDKRAKNQIDNIMINKRWRSVIDAWTYFSFTRSKSPKISISWFDLLSFALQVQMLTTIIFLCVLKYNLS